MQASRTFSHIAMISMILGLVAALMIGLAGPGYRQGWWDLSVAFFTLFKYGVYVGIAAAVLGLVVIVARIMGKTATWVPGVIGLVLGVAAAAVPVSIRSQGSNVPAIHDITTDAINPPEFVDIAPLRADASNPVDYDPGVHAQQQQAYPDIKTERFTESADEVFDASLAAVEATGWELVASDRDSGRIEATETTQWFGFRDDVVIRVRSQGAVTLLDIRSKSRVGRSDLGVNAARIRKLRDDITGRVTAG